MLWDAPMQHKEIFKETQASKLGDAPMHPLLHQQLSVRLPFHYIFITSCVVCYAWSVSLLGFIFSFYLSLLAVHKKLEPNFICVGEKHAPLSKPRTHHRIFHAYIFAVSVLYLFHSYCHV